ncbi:MAG: hypothetical protein DI535_30820, partial [Citrobacter freundii]
MLKEQQRVAHAQQWLQIRTGLMAHSGRYTKNCAAVKPARAGGAGLSGDLIIETSLALHEHPEIAQARESGGLHRPAVFL